MTDAEIRGRLLLHFHALRHHNGGWIPIDPIILAPEPVTWQVIGGVCQQLADISLIQWKPLHSSNGLVTGMAKITGQGVAAVESGRSVSIDIRFPLKNKPVPNEVNPAATESSLVAGAVAGMPAAESSVIDVPAIMAATAASMKAAIAPEPAPVAPSALVGPRQEILTLKPTFMGMGIDLKEVGRRVLPWVQRRFGSKS